MRPLARDWFARPAPAVALELLNKLLVSTIAGDDVVGRIIEVEAYTQDDPASHSFRGRTARNASMFGPPGHLYVYLSYGIHQCANVVTGPPGVGEAVLVRAVTPITGIATMRDRRGRADDRSLVDGPGKLTQAFGINRAHDGVDLVASDAVVTVLDDGVTPPHMPRQGPRIGLSKGVDTPWRFRVPPA